MAKTTKKDAAWEGYQSPSQEAVAKAQQRVADGGGGNKKPYVLEEIDLYRARLKDNEIRIVPPLEHQELGLFGLEIFLHRGVGPNRDVVLCPASMWNERCPVCERLDPAWTEAKRLKDDPAATKAEKDKAWTYAKSLFPDYKVLTWIIDRLDVKDGKMGEKLILYPMPKTIVEEVLAASNRKDTSVMIDVAHPLEGRVVYFERQGSGIGTKYKGIQIGGEPDVIPDWAAQQRRAFKDILIKPIYAEFAAACAVSLAVGDPDDEPTTSAPELADPDEGKDELDRLDIDEMKALIKDGNLPIKARKDWVEEDYRTAIRALISGGEVPSEEEAPPAEEPEKVPEDIEECYKKQFDTYNECDDCPEPFRSACKTACAGKTEEAPAEDSKPADETGAEAGAEDRKALMAKIQGAIQKRKDA